MTKDTRERVLNLAREYHYQPSIHARLLRETRSHTLGLVVPEITNHGFAVFSYALENLCRDAGLETVVVNNLVARQVDGLIVASSMFSDSDYVKLSEQLPMVLFDGRMNDTRLPLVMTDSVTPTADLVEHLARTSPNEISFLGGQTRLPPTQDRLTGFMQGLESAGVKSRPEWIIHGYYHPSSDYEMFASLCGLWGRPPKVIFTAACGLLEGVLRYISQHHLLADNIHIVSFDDHYLYDSQSMRIDTIEQDVPRLAQECFTVLTRTIDGDEPVKCQIIILATLRLRHSGQHDG